jgi:putative ABC transport system permease protein
MNLGPILRAMGRNKARFGLIALEIALTLAIVTNCVAMIADARTQMARPSGFDDENLLVVDSTPFDRAFQEDGYRDNAVREDLRQLAAMPGVRSAMNTRFLPWQGGGSSNEMRAAGTQGEMMRTQIYPASETLTSTLDMEIVEGRNLTREDVERDTARLRELFATQREMGPDGKPKSKFTQEVVITQAYAKLVFGEGSVLGKMLEDSDGDLYRIIGVVDQFYNPYGWPIHEYAVFYPNMSHSFDFGARYLVRTEPGQRGAVLAALEEKLTQVNAGRTLRLRTIEEVKANFFGGKTIVVKLMGTVIVLLVLVTSLGIVGLTSFSVTERTRQIGTRRALGARQTDVLRHFLLENWLVTTIGLVVGVALAYAVNVALVSGAGAARMNPALLGLGIVLLWAAGLGSTIVPALRASRISPAIATRNV